MGGRHELVSRDLTDRHRIPVPVAWGCKRPAPCSRVARVGLCMHMMACAVLASSELPSSHVARLYAIVVSLRSVSTCAAACPQAYPLAHGETLWDSQRQQVISQPTVRLLYVHEDDSFVLLASDSIWDVFSDEDAVSHVQSSLRLQQDVQRAAAHLTNQVNRPMHDKTSKPHRA